MIQHVFIVDTDEYSGNFERELCAYMTCTIGECGVGSEVAQAAAQSGAKDYSDFMEQVPDENGCHRPVAIWTTPGWINDGAGNHRPEDMEDAGLPGGRFPSYQSVLLFFEEELTDEDVENLKTRAHEYAPQGPFNIIGFRMGTIETETKEEFKSV